MKNKSFFFKKEKKYREMLEKREENVDEKVGKIFEVKIQRKPQVTLFMFQSNFCKKKRSLTPFRLWK